MPLAHMQQTHPAIKIIAKRNLDHLMYVTQPALPPSVEFLHYLKELWTNEILNNGSSFNRQFKKSLQRLFKN